MRSCLVGVAVVAATVAAVAQAPEKLPTFEVATIKPSDPASQGQFIRRQPGGRFSTSNMPTRELVRFAYNVQDSSWMRSRPGPQASVTTSLRRQRATRRRCHRVVNRIR